MEILLLIYLTLTPLFYLAFKDETDGVEFFISIFLWFIWLPFAILLVAWDSFEVLLFKFKPKKYNKKRDTERWTKGFKHDRPRKTQSRYMRYRNRWFGC